MSQTHSELKLCPFCGSKPDYFSDTRLGVTEHFIFCSNRKCSAEFVAKKSKSLAEEHWNTRPIEDEKDRRIAELDEQVKKFEAVKQDLQKYGLFKPSKELKEENDQLRKRIEELEKELESSHKYSIPVIDYREMKQKLNERIIELEGALRRLASNEAFTVARVANEEEKVRMEFASQALTAKKK